MPVTPTVLIISRDSEVKLVITVLQAEGVTCRSASSLDEMQRSLADFKGRCVAVLDDELTAEPNFPAGDALECLRSLPLLVLLPPGASPASVADGQRGSMEEYARKPISASVLALRIKALILTAGLALPTPASSAHAQLMPLDATDLGRGQLTVVFSVKGGAGKSTVASNLAVGLASLYSFRVLLVDANLWFGDLGVLLNLTSTRSSFDVCATEDPDLFALPKAVVAHESGASVLLRPPDPLSVEKIKPRTFVEAIDRYRSLYEHVVVDCAASLDELNLDLLEAATRILLVVTPEMGALHNTARFLGLAERLGHSKKISLVLNRSNSGISAVACGIVSAGRMMLDAVNAGTTLFAMDPMRRERITQDLAGVVALVAGREQPPLEREAHRSSPLRFLRRSA
jgi:MinD-like ATPase involved in chromosome partitioning or flagellar assembly